MTNEMAILGLTAASIGFFHTLLGPDHYLPFIMMARAGKWSQLKTTVITFLCGVGHIASSVLVGIIGITLGIAVTKLEAAESIRGNLAAWLLIGFGLVYFVWGVRKALRSKSHGHWHPCGDAVSEVPHDEHIREHRHGIGREDRKSFRLWVLFTAFVLGPCEPLIPILMYPAAKRSLLGLVLVTSVFGSVTIATMLGIVLVSSLGVNILPVGRLDRYAHALAGATICLCGVGIQVLGL